MVVAAVPAATRGAVLTRIAWQTKLCKQLADAFNLGGSIAHMSEIVAGIEVATPTSRGQITFDDKPLPFPAEMDGAPLEAAIGPIRHTPLAEGISATVALFRSAIGSGRLAID